MSEYADAMTMAREIQERAAAKAAADPVTASPTLTGPHGRAWSIPKSTIPDPPVASWMVEAPWAHPMWHSYLVVTLHLRSEPGERAPEILLPGATHQINVMVADPEHPRQPQIEGNGEFRLLLPVNFAAQFVAEDDAAAAKRTEETVQLIVDGRLSPDTDFRRQWIALFGDNMMRREPPIAPD